MIRGMGRCALGWAVVPAPLRRICSLTAAARSCVETRELYSLESQEIARAAAARGCVSGVDTYRYRCRYRYVCMHLCMYE